MIILLLLVVLETDPEWNKPTNRKGSQVVNKFSSNWMNCGFSLHNCPIIVNVTLLLLLSI